MSLPDEEKIKNEPINIKQAEESLEKAHERIKSEGIELKPFEQSSNYCGPAALKILLSYFGKDFTEDQLAQMTAATRAMGPSTRGTGTEHEGMMEAIKAVDGYVFVKEGGTIEELEYFVKKEKLPVIVGWFDRDDDHYSVVVNVTDKHIVMVDPAFSVPKRFIDRDTFPKIWFDFVGKDDKIVSWAWYMVVNFEKKKYQLSGGHYY